jgi:hypothetical protein
MKFYRLHNIAGNGSVKGREFRMKETPDGELIPRDPAYPLAALKDAKGGLYKKSQATEVTK